MQSYDPENLNSVVLLCDLYVLNTPITYMIITASGLSMGNVAFMMIGPYLTAMVWPVVFIDL